MRLTKSKSNLKRENEIRNRNMNINRDLKHSNYSNQINEYGGAFLKKFLKANQGYKVINNKMKIDQNNPINLDENLQNIFSSDENKQKAIGYINSINDKRNEKYKKIKIEKNNYIYNFRKFATEQDDINDTKSDENINEEIEESNYIDKFRKINNKNKIENNTKSNIYNAQASMDYLYKNEQNRYCNEKDFMTNSYTLEENNYTQKEDKIKNINKKEEFFKKLNNVSLNKNENKINNKRSFNNKIILPKGLSPKSSSSQRHFSPFKECLSKSSYNFYINKVSNINNSEQEYQNNFSVRHFQNKNPLTSRNTEKGELAKKNIKEMNSLNYNNVIYRNKKILSQKIFQSYALNSNTTRNRHKKCYICINNRYQDESQKENDEKNGSKIDNINENEEKDEKIKNINKEELKKYLNYFIKDITPININQFVIYSHSNNNYKNDEKIPKNEENSDIFSINKSYNLIYLKT